MKPRYILLLAIIILSCNTQRQQESIFGSEIDETELNKSMLDLLATISTADLRDTMQFSTDKYLANNCSDIPTSRPELDGIKTIIKIHNGKTEAGISVPGFGGLKLGKEEISYSVYYVEPKLVTCEKEDKIFGSGYSLHLLIKKLKRGIDISKLPVVAASVQLDNNKTEVYYSLQTHGVKGIILVPFFKPVINKPFDVEGFGIMQSSIDGIHNILGDSILSNQLKFKPVEIGFIKPSDLTD